MKTKATYTKTVHIDGKLLHIDTNNILKSLQVPAEKADSYLLEQIDVFSRKCLKICAPCSGYKIVKNPCIKAESGILNIDNVRFSTGKIVAGSIKKSTQIAFFICTIGEQVEQLSKQLIRDGNILEGYIVDLIGSELAEETADIVHRTLGDDMKEYNLNITNRYSPGYCNWPVSDQQQLFALMDTTFGVTLKPSSLMIPVKSVSGMVGIGADVRFRGYACSKCDAAFCIYRDKRMT